MNPNDPFNQLPESVSTFAPHVDSLYNFIFWLSAILGLGVVLPMFYFIWKYHHSHGHKERPTVDHKGVEIAWTFLPLVPLFVLFAWGFKGYMFSVTVPDNAINVRVRAMQWNWTFQHAAYQGIAQSAVVSHELVVPVDVPVHLTMSSADVLHSFFIPAFRVKRDAIPGMYTTIWFEATKTGTYDIFCAEYCGASAEMNAPAATDTVAAQNQAHSGMIATVRVVSMNEYKQYLRDHGAGRPQDITPVAWGEQKYNQYCKACHSSDGAPGAGPTWKGIFGRTQQTTAGPVTSDANYLRESILQPGAKVVQGFPNVMPPFQGTLSDEDIDSLIEFMKTLH